MALLKRLQITQNHKKKSIDTTYTEEGPSLTTSSSKSNLKENDGQASALNTTIESEDAPQKNMFETEIDNSVSLRPNEYSSLDKLIINKLSETVTELSRFKGFRSSILSSFKSDEDSKCVRLKKIIDVFLQSDESVFSEVKFFESKSQAEQFSEIVNGALLKNLVHNNRV